MIPITYEFPHRCSQCQRAIRPGRTAFLNTSTFDVYCERCSDDEQIDKED